MQLEKICNPTCCHVYLKETQNLDSPESSQDIILSVGIAALVNRNWDFW